MERVQQVQVQQILWLLAPRRRSLRQRHKK
jgi:hypothetical protein